MRRLLFAMAIAWMGCTWCRAGDAPNVLLIVADDLGFSDLGCFGGEIQTPHLDRLAAGGVRLARFYNAGRCCPSRASILTGHYPHRVGLGHMVKDLGQPGYRGRLADRVPTLGDVLTSAGYRCFIAGKWHLGTPDPTRHGFEQFFGTLVSARSFWDESRYLRLPDDQPRRRYDDGEFYGTDAVTDHALDFLASAGETPAKPWFLYLAYHAPHFPLHAREADIAKYATRYEQGWDAIRARRLQRLKSLGIVNDATRLTPRSPYWHWGESETGVNPAWESVPNDRRADLARRMAIYAAMIDRMDHNIGRVVQDLRTRGQLDNTLIVFLSDNGACAEWDPYGFDTKSGPTNILHTGDDLTRMGGPGTYHSVGSGWANASNTPWRLYKHYTHEGGTSTPGIVHWPDGIVRRDAIDHRPAHIIDLVPTMIHASGVSYSGGLPLEGTSMLPLVRGEPVEARRLYFEHEGNRAVAAGRWKLVSRKGESWELFDMEHDRTELDDLAERHPEMVTKLANQWRDWAASHHVTPLPRSYGVEYLRD